MPSASSSKLVVYAALAGNLLVATTKFVAAAISGSAAMLSEAVHSLVDTLNEVLLLYGYRRAARSPDRSHPLGYGRELYFWSFIVALLLFGLGAGVSLIQGVIRLRAPQAIDHVAVNYAVLGLSFLFEGTSWLVALRNFRRASGGLTLWQGFRRSKDPPSYLVLFEDTAALVGISLAAAGTFAANSLNLEWADGAASVSIGLVLAITAGLLARESKELLIGERADPAVTSSIQRAAAEDEGVTGANGVLTVQLGPEQIVAVISLEFEDELRTPEIEACVIRLEQRVRALHPEVVALFVKPQSRGRFARSDTAPSLDMDELLPGADVSTGSAPAGPDTPA